MSTKIFLSYADADHVFATEVANGLKQDGVEVWSDDQFEVGDRWLDQLRNSLEHSDAVVFILSNASLNSSTVMMELGAAKALEKPMVALRHQTELPSALAELDLKTLDATMIPAWELSHTIRTKLAA